MLLNSNLLSKWVLPISESFSGYGEAPASHPKMSELSDKWITLKPIIVFIYLPPINWLLLVLIRGDPDYHNPHLPHNRKQNKCLWVMTKGPFCQIFLISSWPQLSISCSLGVPQRSWSLTPQTPIGGLGGSRWGGWFNVSDSWVTCVSNRHGQKCVTVLKLRTELKTFFYCKTHTVKKNVEELKNAINPQTLELLT